jgi:hypothetical protein
MTKAEKERAEKNRLKALTLKKTRVLARPSAQQVEIYFKGHLRA